MIRCEKCKKSLNVGDEAHVIDETVFCSEECAIVHLVDEIICSAKEMAKETYNDNVTISTIRPTGNHATCKVCNKDLATCETIFAAEGNMYCSRECGVHDYALTDGDLPYASGIFDSVAEELTPDEIGLEVTADET